MIAAAAMALSSLSVVGNANRLRRYRPTPLLAEDIGAARREVGARNDQQASTGNAVIDANPNQTIEPAAIAAAHRDASVPSVSCARPE